MPACGLRCVGAPWSAAAWPACDLECSRPYNESLALGALARAAHTEFAAGETSVEWFDLHDLMCDDRRCGVRVPGTEALGIYDTKHLSDAGGFYLWPHLRGFLRARAIL